MYLAVSLLLILVFLALCFIGLFTLIRQAVEDRAFAAPRAFMASRAFIDDAPTAAAAPSKDAESGPCGEGCA